ncbi:MAG: DUF559 domain-containing protein [Magnetospirillum sp.]|nr:DUF559 domain-containing protein [Magnetospirillum sp.]
MARLSEKTKTRARSLRQTATLAERALWRLVTSTFPAWRFRRQHPVGPYFVDIACVKLRLAIETDGGQHAESRHDAGRDVFLRRQGWRVLRFWNEEVLQAPDSVTALIAEALAQPPPQPSPSTLGEGD